MSRHVCCSCTFDAHKHCVDGMIPLKRLCTGSLARAPTMMAVDDGALAQAVRKGGAAGAEAFSELVRRHQSRIVRLAGYLLSNSSEAEDVAQAAFVRVYLAFDRFPEGASFQAWMRVVVTRLAYNHRRDNKTLCRYHDQLEAPTSGQDVFAEREALRTVLSGISWREREILLLRYVEEMSVKEIADFLDLGLSATKMRLLRARGQFDDVWRRETEPSNMGLAAAS